jgi:predicted transcriptional regulator
MKATDYYNLISLHTKDGAGFPSYYYELSVDQKFLVDKLLEIRYDKSIEDLARLTEEMADLVSEMKDSIKEATNAKL